MSGTTNGTSIFQALLLISTLEKYLYPRAESNRNRQNRNLKFYPLNYGGELKCKYTIFFVFLQAVHKRD